MILGKISLFALILITGTVYSQNKSSKMESFNLSDIYEKVKSFDEQPEYWLFLHTGDCSYVILLDDMPVYTAYNESGMKSVSLPLNNFILGRKKSEIKVLILPKVDDNGHLDKLLGNEFSFDLRMTRTENKKEVTVFAKKIDYSDKNESFKKVYIPFESNVPYKLNGWTDSVDLTKENNVSLKKEVESFYKEMMDDYREKRIENIAKKYYNRQLENAQAFYLSKREDSEKLITEINKDINKKQDFNLEHYKLVFYGNGKVVGLIRTDNEFLGKSAFLGLTDEDFYIYSLLLHRPKPNGDLEVIR
ncbi:hypothetical protein L1276_004915 [Flavobacterium sp. HSC-32F16]|uniref:DUF3387 domain-containing protein n=1 Tax=Flavobacterium sp. HSC-32F16 TaxID=2910964 RepID=UPI0020A57218|nr:DUF3387 domain-containing protein [Flavobacterium sp. HSC-32F16]MCP2029721.1 hypothetical protein [Flavobacterium sp. HSC-32F16]